MPSLLKENIETNLKEEEAYDDIAEHSSDEGKADLATEEGEDLASLGNSIKAEDLSTKLEQPEKIDDHETNQECMEENDGNSQNKGW